MMQEPIRQKNLVRNMLLLALLFSVFVGIVVYIISLFLTPKYQAETKVLITDNQDKNGEYNSGAQDAAGVFAEIINSKSFVEDLFSQAGVGFDSTNLENGIINHIDAVISKDSPVIAIKLYHDNKEDLAKVSKAVLDVLNNKKYDLGKSKEINITQLDPPYVYSNPVSPKPFKNAAIAFFVVLAIGTIFVYAKT